MWRCKQALKRRKSAFQKQFLALATISNITKKIQMWIVWDNSEAQRSAEASESLVRRGFVWVRSDPLKNCKHLKIPANMPFPPLSVWVRSVIFMLLFINIANLRFGFCLGAETISPSPGGEGWGEGGLLHIHISGVRFLPSP
jgi:hypothetical protein